MNSLIASLRALVASLTAKRDQLAAKTPPVSLYVPPSATITPTSTPTAPRAILTPTAPYDWSTPEAARHSLRVICDEEGLTLDQKNNMSRTIHCESGYVQHVVMYNTESGPVRREKYEPAKHGKIYSIDTGIAQWNDVYHGNEISKHDAEYDPEKAIRLMCKYVKSGQLKQWVCWSSGKALKFTP